MEKLSDNKIDTYALLGDVPVQDPFSDDQARPDLLNFQSTATVLARAAVQTHDPLTIGIFGEWGTGKTSMMNLIKASIDTHYSTEAIGVWFNAWQHEKEEHLIVHLIAAIDRELSRFEERKQDLSEVMQKIIKDLHGALRDIVDGISIITPYSFERSGKNTPDKDVVLPKGTKPDAFYVDAFDQLKLCAKLLSRQALRIVVFIDDMDRCFPENAVKLLEGIKLMLHQPGFSFVLGVNENIIQAFIRTKYAQDSSIPVDMFDDYLDKMVQVKIPVPRRETEGMHAYIGNLLREVGILSGANDADQGMQDDLIRLTAQACNNNPRKIVRMLNRIMVTTWISREDHKDKTTSAINPLALIIHISTEEYADFRTALDAWITVGEGEHRHLKMIGEYLAELIVGYEHAAGRLKEKNRPGKLGGRRDLLETAIEVLENKPFLCKVLQTPAGQEWLKEKQFRAQLGMAAQPTAVKDQISTQRELHIDRKDPIGVLLNSLVKIPAGEFRMGSDEIDTQAYSSEKPCHMVRLTAFEIGAMPVTQAQYEAVMGKNPARFKGPDNPVEGVSWEDAQAFCTKLSGLDRTGRIFILPSEAQWEYACRAGSQTSYYFGGREDQLTEYAWFDKNAEGQTHPAGIKKPNAWGLYDMHGNVWEWCQDSWHENYQGAPDNGMAWVPEEGSYHMLRGGSWNGSAGYCRSASRYGNVPGYRDDDIGFRVLAIPASGEDEG